MTSLVQPRSKAASAFSGMRWGGASMAVNVIAQLGFTALMARLLDPAAFGVMAMATIALRLFAHASLAGLGAALVQRERLEARHVETALGLSLLTAGATMLALVLAAPLVAAFFHDDTLAPVLQALSLNLLLAALAALPTALLRRALRFKALAAIETAAYLVGYGAVGVLLAWFGAGVWSLVGATLAHGLLGWLLAFVQARHSMRPRLGIERRELLAYGSRFSLVGLLEFLSANLPGAVIGRLLGVSALGLFSRAWLLTNLPVEKASAIVARVLFPLIAQVQGERSKAAGVFLLALSAIGLLAAAANASIAAMAGPLVRLLLGGQWTAAVPVVEVLALSVPCIFMATMAGTVCDALALLRVKMAIQAGALLLIAALMFAWHGHGLLGIAWALVVGEALRLAAFLLVLPRSLGCRPRELLAALGSVLAAGGVAYAATVAALRVAAGAPLPVQVALGGLAALFGLATGAGLWGRWLAGSGAAALAARHRPRWTRLRDRP